MQTLAVPSPLTFVRPRTSAAAASKPVRHVDWILFAFFAYAPWLTFFVPTPAGLRMRLALLNATVILAYAGLVYLNYPKPLLALEVMLDWLPLGLILLGYREMGWFALPHHGHVMESRWVVWDRLVLHDGGRATIESLGPVLPSILEIAYALVYALPPIALAAVYLYGRREMADRFLSVVLLSILACYAQFPFWPSEPPRVVFFGQDLPSYDTVFRHFNLWMLGHYGIHTSVFPSAHVAGALSSAFGVRLAIPGRKWLKRVFLVTALLIVVATVYGRYHYLADAICGAAVATLVAVLYGRQKRSSVVRCQKIDRSDAATLAFQTGSIASLPDESETAVIPASADWPTHLSAGLSPKHGGDIRLQ